MYVSPNFKTKKQLREALEQGKDVSVFSPGPFPCKVDGRESIEGPHYPQPHTWYASIELVAGKIVKLDGKAIKARPVNTAGKMTLSKLDSLINGG